MGDTQAEVITKKFPNSVTVVHEGNRYKIDIDKEISIDQQDLMTAFLDQAGKYAWYATVHSAAVSRVERLERKSKVVRSMVADRMRRMKGEDGKKISETEIGSRLDSDPEVVKAEEEVMDARSQEGVLRAVKEAFVHRRDMLTQIGADVRQEKRDRGF